MYNVHFVIYNSKTPFNRIQKAKLFKVGKCNISMYSMKIGRTPFKVEHAKAYELYLKTASYYFKAFHHQDSAPKHFFHFMTCLVALFSFHSSSMHSHALNDQKSSISSSLQEIIEARRNMQSK